MLDEFPGQLLIAENHTVDIWEIPWTLERRLWYGVPGSPTVRFDGLYASVGAPSCSSATVAYRALITQRLAETDGLSPVQIAGSYGCDEEAVEVHARFELVDSLQLESPRAFVLVLEDDLLYGETLYDYITRAAYEQDVALDQAGDTVNVTTRFVIDPDWDADHLRCIAFLQKMTGDREVYQTAQLLAGAQGVAESYDALAARICSIAPNPIRMSPGGAVATIALAPASAATRIALRLDLIDAAGRLVRTLHRGFLDGDPRELRWDGRDGRGAPVSAGVYYVRLATPTGVQTVRAVVIR